MQKLLHAYNEAGIDANTEKTKYIFMFRDQNGIKT